MSREDVHKAAERAAQAQREWAALTYDRRAEVLRSNQPRLSTTR